MSTYPDRWHPCYFLEDALRALGATAEVIRDERSEGCWALLVNGKVFVYLIDNRMEHERAHEDPAAKRLMDRGAIVACAQRPDAERIGSKWLPLAASPGYGLPDKSVNKAVDVAFVGFVRDMSRATLLADVRACFSLSVAQGVFGDAAVETYWRAKVGLNIPTQYGNPLAYDIPMRVPEVLSTGTPLVTNALPELAELGIIDGVTCLTYANADGALSAIKRLVDDPELALQIGANGAKLATEKFTYQQRAQTVLEWLRD